MPMAQTSGNTAAPRPAARRTRGDGCSASRAAASRSRMERLLATAGTLRGATSSSGVLTISDMSDSFRNQAE
jgi:hypothetical protein